jgi:quercetin dioxygenase-like cupin family protein
MATLRLVTRRAGGKRTRVDTESFTTAELSDAWVDGDGQARWRSTTGHTGSDSGSSLLEVPAGCRLPRHTDSAEETIVVVSGTASVTVGDEQGEVPAGGVALVPECVPHEVRNAGAEPLRFVALYAGTDVVTTYEQPIEPGGDRERRPLG